MPNPVIPWVVAYIGFAVLVAGLALVAYAQGAREPLVTTEIGQVLLIVGVGSIAVVLAVNYGTPVAREMFQQLHQHVQQISSAGAPQ